MGYRMRNRKKNVKQMICSDSWRKMRSRKNDKFKCEKRYAILFTGFILWAKIDFGWIWFWYLVLRFYIFRSGNWRFMFLLCLFIIGLAWINSQFAISFFFLFCLVFCSNEGKMHSHGGITICVWCVCVCTKTAFEKIVITLRPPFENRRW